MSKERYVCITATKPYEMNILTCPILLKIHDENITTEEEIVQAVTKACNEYIQTEEGKRTYQYNCEAFDWADFSVNVPNSICEKYGFTKEDTIEQQIDVDWEDQLVTEEIKDDIKDE